MKLNVCPVKSLYLIQFSTCTSCLAGCPKWAQALFIWKKISDSKPVIIPDCLNPEKTFCEVGFLQKYVSNGDHRQLVASQGAIVLVKIIRKKRNSSHGKDGGGNKKKMFEGVETRRRGKYCPGSNASDYWESMGYFLRGASIWGKLGLKTKGKETWAISCFVDHKSFDSTWDLTLPTVVLERVAKQHPQKANNKHLSKLKNDNRRGYIYDHIPSGHHPAWNVRLSLSLSPAARRAL